MGNFDKNRFRSTNQSWETPGQPPPLKSGGLLPNPSPGLKGALKGD